MKKLIIFSIVFLLVLSYAIPHISKAFSLKDLLPNFSVKTEAQTGSSSSVDKVTKDLIDITSEGADLTSKNKVEAKKSADKAAEARKEILEGALRCCQRLI